MKKYINNSISEDNVMRLEIKEVSKQYPKTLALDSFTAELTNGLCHAVSPPRQGMKKKPVTALRCI